MDTTRSSSFGFERRSASRSPPPPSTSSSRTAWKSFEGASLRTRTSTVRRYCAPGATPVTTPAAATAFSRALAYLSRVRRASSLAFNVRAATVVFTFPAVAAAVTREGHARHGCSQGSSNAFGGFGGSGSLGHESAPVVDVKLETSKRRAFLPSLKLNPTSQPSPPACIACPGASTTSFANDTFNPRSRLGLFHTSDRRDGVERRQMELKGVEVCRD